MAELAEDIFTLQSTSTRYRLLLLVLSPFVLAHAMYRSLKDGGVRYFKQRFGFGYARFESRPVHFHCASVGEFLTAKRLILSLAESYPRRKFMITTNTPTGASLVIQLEHSRIHHAYLPIDFRCAVKRFLSDMQPLCCFILETEIWPNFYAEAAGKNIKIAIINARLSVKTLQVNQFIKSEYARALKNVMRILARTDKDFDNYLHLGANRDTIQTLGNLKYSVVHAKPQQHACTTIKRPFFLAVSTHADEELQLSTHRALLKREGYLLVIAPRYPDRCQQLITQFRTMGLEVAVRSRDDTVCQSTDIYIIDTLGELNLYFSQAALVFIGGSLIPRGGHNVLEPAAFGKCMLVGPYTDNFSNEVKELLDAKALVQVKNNHALGVQLAQLLKNDEQRKQLGENAALFMNRQASIFEHYLEQSSAMIEASLS